MVEHAGGAVAAPIFRRVGADERSSTSGSRRKGSRIARTSPSWPDSPIPAARGLRAAARRPTARSPPVQEAAKTGPVAAGKVRVPDMTGWPLREAIRRALELGVTPRVQGTGLLVAPDAAAGRRGRQGADSAARLRAGVMTRSALASTSSVRAMLTRWSSARARIGDGAAACARRAPGFAQGRSRATCSSPRRARDQRRGSRRRRAGRGAVALLVRARRRRSRAGRAGDRGRRRRAGRSALAAEAVLRLPTRASTWSGSPAPTARPRPRFSSQQAISGAGGRAGRLGTLGFAFAGDSVGLAAHDAGGRRGLALRGAGARSRRDAPGDGGLEPRARAGARRRVQLRGRRLHQPHPGPPRLPRHDGRVRRGQAAAVHRALAACRGRQRRRCVRRGTRSATRARVLRVSRHAKRRRLSARA